MANVVIVVDMLRGFHDMGNLKNPRVDNIIQNIANLLEKRLQNGERVVFLRDYHAPNDKEFEMFPRHCVRGTKETRIIPQLESFAELPGSAIINKVRYSGLYKTRLGAFLRKEHPQHITVVGVCTDICVLILTAELRIRDYNVAVLEDCVETFDAPGHEADQVNRWVLNYMRSILGAKVISSKELL